MAELEGVDRDVLTEEISAPTVGGVRTVITGYPADGLDPSGLAVILKAADQGNPLRFFELAETIEERDLHYAGVLQTRKRSVAQLEVTVAAASDDKRHIEHAERIRDWLDRDELQDEMFDILDAIGKGISLTEIIWDTSTGQWQPARLEWRDPRWFTFDRTDGRTPLLRTNQGDEPLPAFKFIGATMRAKSGLPVRSGLARLASWSWMFKAFTQRDWAIFTATYGQPIRIGRYQSGATEKDKRTLLRAVTNIAGDCAAIVPIGMEIELVQPPSLSGSVEHYEKRSDWLDRQISKAVLGQTATTDAIAGGHAVGKEHREVQEVIERADCKALSAILNRDLVRPWIDLEFGPQEHYPRLKVGRPESTDTKLTIQAIKDLVPMGLRVAEADARALVNLPEPPEGADILVAPKVPPAAAPDAVTEEDNMDTDTALQAQEETVEGDLEDLVGEALESWPEDMAGLIDPIRDAAAAAQGFDDFVRRLDGLIGEMDAGAIIDRLARAAFKARGLGDTRDR